MRCSVFHRIRRSTGQRHVWLRATGSTAISPLIDSFVVLYIDAALALIRLLYLVRGMIHRYLGHAQAEKMMQEAARG